MRDAIVHGVEHRFEETAKKVIARRASEAASFFKILLGKATGFAADIPGGLGIKRRLQQQISQREPTGIRHALGLGAGLTQINLMDFIINDLRQMNRRRLNAKIAFERISHGGELKSEVSRPREKCKCSPRPA